jgi:hypothetical protein
MKKAEKKKSLDDDEQPFRTYVRERFEGNCVTITMALVTLFALFGDEIKQGLTGKPADFWFDLALAISILLFITELLINSCISDDFKWSFFFWLDIIATLSLLPDVAFILDFLQGLLGMDRYSQSNDVVQGALSVPDTGNDKLGKIIKSLRLIRLIRIIKLYKYAAKSSAEGEEARLREMQKSA